MKRFYLMLLITAVASSGCQNSNRAESDWQKIGNVRPYFQNERNALENQNLSPNKRRDKADK